MRTNLTVPYAQKDEAKALGARWDPARKCWYIQDAKDLAPFARWLSQEGDRAPAAAVAKVPRTGPAQPPAHCGCDVLPWEPCVHTPPGA
jgi:hypothetical protein